MNSPYVAFVGALPPPTHGFSVMNAQMLELIRAQRHVRVFGSAPLMAHHNRYARIANRIAGALWFGLSCFVSRPTTLYIGLSSKYGLLIDCLYIAIAKIFGTPSVLHHHNFSYVSASKWYAAVLFSLSRNDLHVSLCDCMAVGLAGRYGLPSERIVALSNAAVLSVERREEQNLERLRPAIQRPIRIGFLSNITRAKGIATYLSVYDRLSKFTDVEAVIAGPLQEDITEMRDEFAKRAAAKYLGPVYGADKQRFFEQLDFLIFPSYYANEAEPLVVLESLSYGVPVIATKRGCLESMLAGGAGIVIDGESDNFVTESVAFITSTTAEDHADMRAIAKRTFERNQQQATAVLNEVLATICAKE